MLTARRHQPAFVLMFEAQGVLLQMCGAEALLIQDQLLGLRGCLEQLQALAAEVEAGSSAAQQQEIRLARFSLDYKVGAMPATPLPCSCRLD